MSAPVTQTEINRSAQRFHDASGIGLAGIGDKEKIIAGLEAVFAAVQLQVIDQFAVCEVGVFGPLGQNAQFHPTADAACDEAHRVFAEMGDVTKGAITRKTVFIDGAEFHTEWETILKTKKEIEEWQPKHSTT